MKGIRPLHPTPNHGHGGGCPCAHPAPAELDPSLEFFLSRCKRTQNKNLNPKGKRKAQEIPNVLPKEAKAGRPPLFLTPGAVVAAPGPPVSPAAQPSRCSLHPSPLSSSREAEDG